MSPPRAGSIPVVRPSINGPFVTETQDKPFPTRKHFFCKSQLISRLSNASKQLVSDLNIETIDSRRLLAESTNGMADHSLYEVFKTSLISLTLF